MPVRRRRPRAALRADPADGLQLARLPARRRARASATATASTGPTRPSTGTASTPPSSCSIRTPRRSTAPCAGTPPTCCRTRRVRRAAARRPTAPTTPRAMPRCVVVDPGFDWEGDQQLETPWHETVIYELHVKGFTKLHPGVREDLRGTYAGLASERGDRVPDLARRDGRRAAAGAPHRRRALPARPGPHELLGLLVDRLPRAARRPTPRPGAHGRAGQGVQGDGQGAAPRRASR